MLVKFDPFELHGPFKSPLNPRREAELQELMRLLTNGVISKEQIEPYLVGSDPFSISQPTYILPESTMVAAPVIKPKAPEVSKKNTGIVGFLYDGEWILLGNTYAYKDTLKSLGCGWNYVEGKFGKNWYYKSTTLPAKLREMIELELGTPNQQEVEQIVQQLNEDPEAISDMIRAKRRIRHEKHLGKHYPLYKKPELGTFQDFVPPSWFDELLFYLSAPAEYPVVVVVGPSGNGKSLGTEEAFRALNREYAVIDMNEAIEAFDLVGGETYDPRTGPMWSNGVVSNVFERGIDLLINEFDAADPRKVICLQSAFQTPGKNKKSRYLATPKHPSSDRLYPQGACQIILTMNTFGSGANMQFVGRNALDAATLDRVAFIATSYENEAKILVAAGYDNKTAKALEKWALSTRTQVDKQMLRVTLSLRLLKRMAHMMRAKSMTLEDAADKAFYSRLEPDDRKLLKG